MARKSGTSHADVLNGTVFGDFLFGFGGKDILRGLAGNDKLYGGAGSDKLFGGAGKDWLDGKEGRDFLTGGGGSDTFVFKHARETRPGSAADTITDFTRKDFIDIRNIDADKFTTGNQDFKFIGSEAFSHDAGELRYEFSGSGARAKTIISGDQNGDGVADFQIILLKHIAISSANILGDF